VNLNTIAQVRHQLWRCFTRSADALFELAEALTCESAAKSLPELSLSPVFRRKWPSIYEALEDGRIESQRWREIWTEALLAEHQGPVWISFDSTSIPRPEAETSPDRGMIYVSNLPHAKRPVSVGWQFSTVRLLPNRRSSWGAALSQERIASSQTAVEVAIAQLEHLRPLLPDEIRVLADRWYPTGPFLSACQGLRVEALMRLKRNRKLYQQHHLPRPENEVPLAKMEPCFREASRKPGENRTSSGRAVTKRASRFRCLPGTTGIFDKHEHLRCLFTAWCGNGPKEPGVILSSVGFAGSVQLPCHLAKSSRPLVTASRMSTPIAFSSRSCAGRKLMYACLSNLSGGA
jgi:hypothetical protein